MEGGWPWQGHQHHTVLLGSCCSQAEPGFEGLMQLTTCPSHCAQAEPGIPEEVPGEGVQTGRGSLQRGRREGSAAGGTGEDTAPAEPGEEAASSQAEQGETTGAGEQGPMRTTGTEGPSA